ncbi:MAG: hypothetical protein PUC18_13315 [Prevotellaceae bacterium]|nr:hypothetical protein [Prevotellaceae bacterium]
MSDRNLLYIELRFGWFGEDAYKEMKENVRTQAGCIHYLRKFRTKPGPYLTWYSYGYHGEGLYFIGFVVRLNSPYDTDFLIPAFRDLPHVKHIETSWFPSREPYGGTVQSDGSVIETWDI